ncbi:hypothetical protein PHALS_14482 [Plasmopara halstedii]|uniref:Uncharacterized protein n=1 Tax=Plasmopara halstedii TaxID=4781 RepID=A0A0P1AU36_PLAHL|nr:hypothetical protein PHALS_14482 [Plasmopara halstedii]|eukprot:XP_024580592.1 hypothetical protein PHALS_14482 [Plasmopara halstedii]
MLTTPRSVVKSSTKDLSFPIFEITIQHTLRRKYLTSDETSIAIRVTSGKLGGTSFSANRSYQLSEPTVPLVLGWITV